MIDEHMQHHVGASPMSRVTSRMSWPLIHELTSAVPWHRFRPWAWTPRRCRIPSSSRCSQGSTHCCGCRSRPEEHHQSLGTESPVPSTEHTGLSKTQCSTTCERILFYVISLWSERPEFQTRRFITQNVFQPDINRCNPYPLWKLYRQSELGQKVLPVFLRTFRFMMFLSLSLSLTAVSTCRRLNLTSVCLPGLWEETEVLGLRISSGLFLDCFDKTHH